MERVNKKITKKYKSTSTAVLSTTAAAAAAVDTNRKDHGDCSIDIEQCPDTEPDAVLSSLVFLLKDETGRSLQNRISFLLETYVKATETGFCIRNLSAVVFVLDNLIEGNVHYPSILSEYMKNASRPITLTAASDVDHYRYQLTDFYNFLGYALIRIEDDADLELVHAAICSQLTAAAAVETVACAPLALRRSVATHSTIVTTAARMLALCHSNRYRKYIELALLLATISPEICIKMVKCNILENILHRFNPYFPNDDLPDYDINPKKPYDDNLKLGDSSMHLTPVISILQILLHNMKQHFDSEPDLRNDVKCPDSHALRCWIWAFRRECRAPERSRRSSLLVISMALLRCFGEQLHAFQTYLMPDIISLSVKTEVPLCSARSWTSDVSFNTTQADAEFKKLLIYCTVHFIKIFPHNAFLAEYRCWVMGLMYLVDPLLYRLRHNWNESLFADIRLAALQALVVAVPLCPSHLPESCGLIQRILLYIEWYTVRPFSTKLLYWSLRLVYAAKGERSTEGREAALRSLAYTHGVIIIVRLCQVLLDEKDPPVERNQTVLTLCLQLLTSAIELEGGICCSTYPYIQWPSAAYILAKTMLETILRALNRHLIITPRWTVALFNFIWESIIWNNEYRFCFIADNGIYKILDVISMSGEAVQCLGLALVCEVARASEATAQLVTWRARPAAEAVVGALVQRGDSLAALLAAIAKHELAALGVRLDRDTGVIQNVDFPLLGQVEQEELEGLKTCGSFVKVTQRGLKCLAAAGLAGSRLSKIYGILQMLSDDLDEKVAIADETYKLFKNVQLTEKDEVTLTLCAHYLVCKIGQVWAEVDAHIIAADCSLLAEDEQLLKEFLMLYQGWVKEIKYQQEQVLEKRKKSDLEEEASFYELLARCRLSSALDALKELRRHARASNPTFLAYERVHRAVETHHSRTSLHLINTYKPPLDENNAIGQNIKVQSIPEATTSPKRYDCSY